MIASSAGEGARRHSEFATSSASSLCCQTLMRRKSRGNAAYLSICQTAPRVASRRTTPMKLDERRIRRPAGAASQPPIGGKLYDQIGESLRKLWRKVRPCQPPPSRPALLPQSLQGELPCENGEGPCVHATVVWLRASQGLVGVAGLRVGVARIERSEIRGSAGSFVSPRVSFRSARATCFAHPHLGYAKPVNPCYALEELVHAPRRSEPQELAH
jgi:hypothetical protein